MSIGQNKQLVLRWREELNRGILNAIDELHATDYVGHIAGTPGPIQGAARHSSTCSPATWLHSMSL
jgi:hypothetical protein